MTSGRIPKGKDSQVNTLFISFSSLFFNDLLFLFSFIGFIPCMEVLLDSSL